MSPEQKRRREQFLLADEENQYAVVELLSASYVEDYPNDSDIYLCLGKALSALCRWHEADDSFERASKEADASDHIFIWLEKAESYKRRGEFSKASLYYQRANQFEPNCCWLLILLAHSTWRCGDLELAEKHFREAASLKQEEQDEAFSNLGGVLVALGRLEEAAECYRDALDLSPNYEIAQIRREDVERAIELRRIQ